MKKKLLFLTALLGLSALIFVTEVKAEIGYPGHSTGKKKCWNSYDTGTITFPYCLTCNSRKGSPQGDSDTCR